jgi:hypothetical protein
MVGIVGEMRFSHPKKGAVWRRKLTVDAREPRENENLLRN